MKKTCIDLERELSNKFAEYESLNTLEKIDHFEDAYGSTVRLDPKGKELKAEIDNLLNQLFAKSLPDKHYWLDCPLATYKETFKNRLKNETSSNPDFNEIDLLFRDLKILHQFPKNRVLHYYNYDHLLAQATKIKFDEAIMKKVEHLKNRIKELGFVVEVSMGEFEFKDIDQLSPFYSEPLDFGLITGTEKVGTLIELGLFDYIIEKYHLHTATRMANFLSLFTGEKYGTLQPMCNVIFSKPKKDKNHPLKSPKTRKRINDRISKIGLKDYI